LFFKELREEDWTTTQEDLARGILESFCMQTINGIRGMKRTA